MTDAAFIGGPYDCKIMSVADDLWRMEYVVQENLALMVEADAPVMPREYRCYQREHWTNGQRQMVVYVEQGVDRESTTVLATADELFAIREIGAENLVARFAQIIAGELPFELWPNRRQPCRRLALYHHRFVRRLALWSRCHRWSRQRD